LTGSSTSLLPGAGPRSSAISPAPAAASTPGRGNADVHYEGRAAVVFLDYTDSDGKTWGDWLFDWCVDNCRIYQIQGVIFGDRQWSSETKRGVVFARDRKDHFDHVHIELNGDGATGQAG
jgi:hypothetical protein